MPFEGNTSVLITLIERLVAESGQPVGFDANAWLDRWLTEPVPALGNRRPLDVLNEPGGLESVRQVLSRMQSGAYC